MRRLGKLLSKTDAPVVVNEQPGLVHDQIRVELEPDEAVEAALQFNAPLIAAIQKSWEQAVEKEKELYDSYNPFSDFGLGAAAQCQGHGGKQRGRELSAIKSSMFYDIRKYGWTVGQAAGKDFLSSDDSTCPMPSGAFLADITAKMTEEITEETKVEFTNAGIADLFHSGNTSITHISELAPLFGKAEALTTIAKVRLHEVLTTPEACAYFVDRVVTMAEIGSQAEIPGLLELLASEELANGKGSVISTALQNIDFSPQSQAVRFINQVVDSSAETPENRYTKEVATAFALLKTVAALFETDTTTTEEDFSEKFAATLETWPQPLVQALGQYAANARVTTTLATKNALAPFVRKKWVMPDTEARFTAQLEPESARSKKRGRIVRGVSQKAVASEISIDSPEQETHPVINNFAVFSRAHGAQNNLALELRTVESMDELLQSPVFQSYFDRYRHDQTLPNAIAKTISHICENPFDSNGSRVLMRGSYRLPGIDGSNSQKHRRLRRFKPTAVAGVNGEIAHQTRIMYDIINYGGEPTLAIYDITIKQDVSQLGPLARQQRR